ncbi:MAG: succinate dehydrogenase / fumarate reductase cytochrome b subunit [Woeseiaceae bacterium]|jgi:succinate dehydrogenase / fumarate reductase cytochrome b subunit
MTLSILHRMTGVALSVGLVALVMWLESIAFGVESYRMLAGWMNSLPGKILLLGWSFSFFFHLCNGVRHLFWDTGMGFEKKQVNVSSWFVLIGSISLTGAYWLFVSGTLT